MDNSLAESARMAVADQRIANLATLADLARARTDPETFYRAVVDVSVESTGAITACIWVGDAKRSWQAIFESQIAIASLFPSADAIQTHHDRLAETLLDPTARSYHCEHVDGTFIATPIEVVGEETTLLEVIVSSRTDPTPDLTFLQLVSEIASEYAIEQSANIRSTANDRQQFDDFLLALHHEPSAHAVAFAMVNDGRAVVGCDRLSLAIRRGRRFEIEAVSGQVEVNERANAVRSLAEIASRVGRVREKRQYPSKQHTSDQEFDSLVRSYLSESTATHLVAEPLLSNDGECTGVLIAEWFSSVPQNGTYLEDVARHGALAVQNTIGRSSRSTNLFRGGKVVESLIGFCVLAAMCLVPADLTIEATGELQPAQRGNVFANRDAVVHKVLVGDGAEVQKGTPLVELRDTDLEYELSRVSGEILTTTERRASLDSAVVLSSDEADARNAAESAELKQHIDSLREQHVILERAHQQLTLKSPVDGQLMTWNPKELLAARPVRRGQVLLTVANPDGDWILDLTVPDEEFAHIVAAQAESTDGLLPVTFRTSTEPGRVCHGTLTDVATTTVMDDVLGPVLRMTVAIKPGEIENLRPGIGVTAHVHCGRRAVGYVWFRDLIDSARGRVAMW